MNLWLALSDIHGNGSSLTRILKACPPLEGVLLLGDITHKGGFKEAQEILGLLEAKLKEGGFILGVFGNMDMRGVSDYLEQRNFLLHGQGLKKQRIGIFGLGGSSPTPFNTPSEFSEEELTLLLATGYAQIKDCPVKILLSHAPPFSTTCDRTMMGLHAGSKAVRDFLLKEAVDICLCGHIHEARGQDRVGNCFCYNLGPAKDGYYALLEIGNSELKVLLKEA